MPSERILEQKKQQVTELSELLKASCAGVVVDYKGISVADDTKLRKDLREAGINYMVIKNSLLRRACTEAGIEGMDDVLKGSTAVALSQDDHIAAARILCKYAEDSKTFEIKAGVIDGAVIDADEVKNLSKLPPREVLVAKALGGLNAPISGLVYVLNANIQGLAQVLNAIAEKKEA